MTDPVIARMPVQTAVVVRQPKAGRVVTGGQGPAGANAAVADATAAALADIDDAINTTGKTARKLVFDTTNNRLMIATGATASAPWFVADGSASVTPA